EEIARVAQIGNPAWAQFLPRRNFVEAKNLVTVRKQLAYNKLSQSTAAARNHDSFHLICSLSFLATFAPLREIPPLSSPPHETCRNVILSDSRRISLLVSVRKRWILRFTQNDSYAFFSIAT